MTFSEFKHKIILDGVDFMFKREAAETVKQISDTFRVLLATGPRPDSWSRNILPTTEQPILCTTTIEPEL